MSSEKGAALAHTGDGGSPVVSAVGIGLLIGWQLLALTRRRRRAGQMARHFWSEVRARFPGQRRGEEDMVAQSIERETARRMALKRMGAFDNWAFVYTVFAVVTHMLHIYHALFVGWRWLTWGQDLLFVTSSLTASTLTFFPTLLRLRTFTWLASIFQVCFIAGVSHLVCNGCCVTWSSVWILFPRAMLGLIAFDWPISVAWNFVFLVVVSTSQAHSDSLNCGVMPSRGRINQEVMLFIFSSSLTILVQASVREELRKDIATQVSKCQHSASSALLNIMCDVVLELDADLRMSDSVMATHPEKLGLMLRDGSGGAPVVGRGLWEFLHAGEDEALFVEQMGRVGPDHETNFQAFHIHMRDGQGSKVNMEFFHVPFTHLDTVRHLVGIRELTDSALPRESSGERVCDAHAGLLPSSAAASHAWESLPGRAAGGGLGFEQALAPSRRTAVPPGAMRVSVDASTMEVVECSGSFRSTLGEPPVNLATWLTKGNVEFHDSYRRSLDSFASGTGTNSTFNVGRILFASPELQAKDLFCEAQCSVTFIGRAATGDSTGSESVLAMVELREVRDHEGRPLDAVLVDGLPAARNADRAELPRHEAEGGEPIAVTKFSI